MHTHAHSRVYIICLQLQKKLQKDKPKTYVIKRGGSVQLRIQMSAKLLSMCPLINLDFGAMQIFIYSKNNTKEK